MINNLLTKHKEITERLKQTTKELSSANANIRQDLHLSSVESALKTVETTLLEILQDLIGLDSLLEATSKEHSFIGYQLAAEEEQHQSARHIAYHDALTQLPNRLLFNDRLRHGIVQAKRYGWSLVVLFIDLDKFKFINDTYGHHIGDLVLQIIAKRLNDSTREEDTVGRHSGDEFVCTLMQSHEQKDIEMIVGKMIRTIEMPCDLTVHNIVDKPCIRVSIGIAIYPKDGIEAEILLQKADAAMYIAKQNNSGYKFSE